MKPPFPRDVLVTGASGAIGQAVSRRLADAGYRLHLCSRRPASLQAFAQALRAQGHPVFLYSLDLDHPGQAGKAVRAFFRKAKHPYGLVLAAGNLGLPGPFLGASFERWALSLQSNFTSHAAMIHTFARALRRRKRPGAIITFSGAGLGGETSFENVSSYSTAKAALTHLVEALAPEFHRFGITINAVAPGAVYSGITRQALRAGVRTLGDYARQAMACEASGGVPPDLAADMVQFLLSPEGRSVSGRLLSARFDRGLFSAKGRRDLADPSHLKLRRIDRVLFRRVR